MFSETNVTRRRFLLVWTLSVTWALLGCRLVNWVAAPTPEPTFAPPIESTTPLQFSPEKLPDAHAGQPYSVTILITDNVTPVYIASIESGELPPELVLQEVKKDSTVEISGIPGEPGEYTFTLSVGCRGTMVFGQKGQHQYTLVVK